jgi:hypothetical protein
VKSKTPDNPRDAAAVRPRWLCFEPLEDRLLLSVSAEEQHFIYLLNLARHDPAGYQREANVPVDLSSIVSRPPLAVNDSLLQAADQRADEMARHDYVAHRSPITGAWPNQVARSHGYELPSNWPDDQNFIESIAAGDWYGQAQAALEALIVDQGLPSALHRRHLLGVDEFYAHNREIGVGLASEPQSSYGHYWAVEIARREPEGAFLTGVVFDDANANRRYDVGEGLPGVTVQTADRTTQTNAGGGFSLTVPSAGWYRILASGPGLAVPVTGSTLVAEDNVHVEVVSGIRGVYLNFAAQPTSAWTNPLDRLDVSNNLLVDPLDALQVINYLNTAGPSELAVLAPSNDSPPQLLDVDGNGLVLPNDALSVINHLNRIDNAGEAEAAVPLDARSSPDVRLPSLTAPPTAPPLPLDTPASHGDSPRRAERQLAPAPFTTGMSRLVTTRHRSSHALDVQPTQPRPARSEPSTGSLAPRPATPAPAPTLDSEILSLGGDESRFRATKTTPVPFSLNPAGRGAETLQEIFFALPAFPQFKRLRDVGVQVHNQTVDRQGDRSRGAVTGEHGHHPAGQGDQTQGTVAKAIVAQARVEVQNGRDDRQQPQTAIDYQHDPGEEFRWRSLVTWLAFHFHQHGENTGHGDQGRPHQ